MTKIIDSWTNETKVEEAEKRRKEAEKKTKSAQEDIEACHKDLNTKIGQIPSFFLGCDVMVLNCILALCRGAKNLQIKSTRTSTSFSNRKPS